MDRKSKQKISLFYLTLVTVLLVLLCFTAKSLQETGVFNRLLQEISITYPNENQGLQETLSYYQDIIFHHNLVFILSVILILLLSLIGVYLGNQHENKRQAKKLEAELEVLYQQVLSLRAVGSADSLIHQEFECTMIGEIHDQLLQLGYDVDTIKTKLQNEESRTKALITDISHQLKTPLASIRMSHELSLTEDITEEERLSFLDTETREILKMEALLDELVKLSRLENSMIQIHPKIHSLKSTIREAVSTVYRKAGAKNIMINFDMEADIETPHDPRWTTEALANIIENAVKYSNAGTSVKIRVYGLVSTVLIEVEDDGIGIPIGEENLIFNRFYRGSNAQKQEKEGAGVGLYLARSIFEQQGGTILAKRKPGSGSVFKITLPL